MREKINYIGRWGGRKHAGTMGAARGDTLWPGWVGVVVVVVVAGVVVVVVGGGGQWWWW